ncbi:MAG: hypothetical protein EPO09_18985 [Aquabacterium sp.]|uniref:hypothetical protein n=1 Tax=Aquabacterium sp. TaxID=1872578 RepID=UPI0012044477|nr:hypothetical protein [Aquabacterium sp.]TAK87080.1 MAG: hypothetical protein EPO09_18985 [Aquabacterium sp.]
MNEMAGAQGDTAIVGIFPGRRNTLQSEVLARLLLSERLTGLDAVAGLNTTRLASAVHILRTKFEWPIKRHDFSVGCGDGRVEQVCEYYLSTEAISAASRAGADEFVPDVLKQRSERRKEAPKAKREAALRNSASFTTRIDPTRER